MVCTLIGLVAFCAVWVQLLYLFWQEAALKKPAAGEALRVPEMPVSVVVCARNEAQNLRRRLPALLEQDYPRYEVVVADDHSDDDTAAVVGQLQQRFPHLRYRRVAPEEKAFSGKKGALQVGVAAAGSEVLLFTDADCLPASPDWIRGMVAALADGKEIVAGYGPYERTPGFLNAVIRAEALWVFLQVKAFHRLGIHYMAVGRNLCVRRQTFLRAAAHPLWGRTLSGDDDMLVRLCATSQNMAVVADPETYLYSPAMPDWKRYRRQKQRHLSTGKYYRLPIKLLLATMQGTHMICWLLLPALVVCVVLGKAGILHFAALGLLVVRMLFFTGFFTKQARRHAGFFSPLLPLAFDAVYAVYPLFFASYIFWKNKNQWK